MLKYKFASCSQNLREIGSRLTVTQQVNTLKSQRDPHLPVKSTVLSQASESCRLSTNGTPSAGNVALKTVVLLQHHPFVPYQGIYLSPGTGSSPLMWQGVGGKRNINQADSLEYESRKHLGVMFVKKEQISYSYRHCVLLTSICMSFCPYILLLLFSLYSSLNVIYLPAFPYPHNSKYLPLCSPFRDILQ